MRHATAETFGETDHERALALSGRRDAEAAGSWLARQEIEPDYALVSSAVRAVSTWEGLAEGAGWELEPDVESALYDAGPESFIDLVRAAPSDARCVLVVGHNPTVAYVAQLLDDGEGDPEAYATMTAGFPPGALAVFEYDGDWEELELNQASLVAFHSRRS